MKKNVLKVLATSLVLGLAAANASAQTIKAPTLSWGKDANGSLSIEYDESIENVEIQDVVLNGGKCPVKTRFPKKLRAEDYGSMRIEHECEMEATTDEFKAVTIVTNGGTFNFDLEKACEWEGQGYYRCYATGKAADELVAKQAQRPILKKIAVEFLKMAFIDGDTAGATAKFVRDADKNIAAAEIAKIKDTIQGEKDKRCATKGIKEFVSDSEFLSNPFDNTVQVKGDFASVFIQFRCENYENDFDWGEVGLVFLRKVGDEWKIDFSGEARKAFFEY